MKGLLEIATPSAMVACLGLAGMAAGCGETDAPLPQKAELEAGIVARVGEISIAQATVSRIAKAQGLAPAEALQIAIGDALFEAEMRRRGALDAASASFDGSLARRARGELSKALLIDIRDEVAGPVTDEELKSLTEKHWMEVKRPKAWRVAHALVLVADPTPEERDAAEARAKRILEVMTPIAEQARSTQPPARGVGANVEDLRSAELRKAVEAMPVAKSPASGEEWVTKVEELPPLVEEGWALAPSRPKFEPEFVKAAVALKQRGDVSPLTWSSFGVHVILLLEIVPGNMVPDDELRKMLHQEATALRAKAEHAALLSKLRESTPVTEANGVDALLREVDERP